MENRSKCSDEYSDNESQLRFEDLHPHTKTPVNKKKVWEQDMDSDDFNYSMDSFLISEFVSSQQFTFNKHSSWNKPQRTNSRVSVVSLLRLSPIRFNCIQGKDVSTSPTKQGNERSRQINAQTNALLFEPLKVHNLARQTTPEERKPKRLRKCKPKKRHVSDSKLVVSFHRAASTSSLSKNLAVDDEKYVRDLKDTKLKNQKKRLKKQYKELKTVSDQLENWDEVQKQVSVSKSSFY